jgi:hypothetical protein
VKLSRELSERLLRAGVAPRHVRRFGRELADHFADLVMEEEGAGQTREESEAAALSRLGNLDDLVTSMTARRQLRSWTSRAPWAMFSLIPLIALAVAYFFACLYLWFGWNVFVPDADTPFGAVVPLYSFSNLYFQVGKLYYYGAPILVGWAMAILAARQRD